MKMQSVKCPGCGVPSFVDAEKSATVFCPYCGRKIMLNVFAVENNRAGRNVNNSEDAEKANSDIPQS